MYSELQWRDTYHKMLHNIQHRTVHVGLLLKPHNHWLAGVGGFWNPNLLNLPWRFRTCFQLIPWMLKGIRNCYSTIFVIIFIQPGCKRYGTSERSIGIMNKLPYEWFFIPNFFISVNIFSINHRFFGNIFQIIKI